MNNNFIKELESHNHLGVILNGDGSWNNLLKININKAIPQLALFRKLKLKLKRRNLETIYLSFIRPVFSGFVRLYKQSSVFISPI